MLLSFSKKFWLYSVLAAVIISVIAILLGIALNSYKNYNDDDTAEAFLYNKGTMQIMSRAFPPGESIPSRYTCDGENVNPEIDFFGVPDNAGSLALVVDDPDSPTGTWVHWILWNIPPGTKKIESGSKPENAAEGITSFGTQGYGGPCPSSGEHRYFFKLYAIDGLLELDMQKTKIEDFERAIEGRILTQAETMGKYKRNQ